MKINKLINELAKGTWCIEPSALDVWGVFVAKLLARENVTSPLEKLDALVNIYDQKANRLQMQEGQKIPKGSVAVVDMIGPMIKYGDWCTYGADEIANALYALDENQNVEAIILNIDGPGGSVSAIAPFVDYGKNKTKPVVALYDQCCSAHLYSAYAMADHVMAVNDISATIGSIGVMVSWKDNREYLEKQGYKFHEVYPAESEHKNEAFRLALEGNYDMIKEEMLSPLAINFQKAVKKARPNLIEEKGVLTGKTFFANEALRLNMIDSIGSMRQAVQVALGLAEIKRFNK
jgi:protease-4